MILLRKMDKLEKRPFKDLLWPLVKSKTYEEKDISQIADMLQRILRWVPADRVSASDLLSHPFYSQFSHLNPHSANSNL